MKPSPGTNWRFHGKSLNFEVMCPISRSTATSNELWSPKLHKQSNNVPLQKLDTNWNKLETYSSDSDKENSTKILELTVSPRTSPWRSELETWMAVLVLSELAAKPQKMFKLCTVRRTFFDSYKQAFHLLCAEYERQAERKARGRRWKALLLILSLLHSI